MIKSAGRHNCLFCLITADSLKIPRGLHPQFPQRSLEKNTADYNNFISDGGDLKKAKLFNNVISPHFFDIELDQVHTHD